MRSRFWLGGVNAEPRRGGKVGAAAVKALQRVRGPDATLAEALVVHCSQEMSDLASLLPATYAELGNDWAFGRTPPRTSFQFALAAARIHGTSSGCVRASQLAICCGDHRSATTSSTMARNAWFEASLYGFARRERCHAARSARCARYR